MPQQTVSFDPTSLAKYGRLSMVARTVVEGFLTGVHKSPYKGFSVEFAEHRQYYPGDEIRHIDWRRSVIRHEQRLQYLYSAFEQTKGARMGRIRTESKIDGRKCW